MEQPTAESLSRIADRADDIRVEAKSLTRKARVLTRQAADLADEVERLLASEGVSQPPVK